MNSSQDGGSRDTKSNAKPVEATSDVFDPFGLGVDSSWSRQENKSTVSPKPPPEVTRLTLFESPSRTSLPSAKKPTASPSALPPRVTVKLRIHEEVSSLARPSGEGASDASVDGTVYAQVQCSDATKNAPFAVAGKSAQGEPVVFQGNSKYVSVVQPGVSSSSSRPLHLVQIDKSEITSVAIGHFSMTELVQHMPILVERKISVHGKVCRVAVQVRSKLTNKGDLEDFTIAIAVPERVNGATVKVVHGDGVWDDLKRSIKWKVKKLEKGSSFMVAAQAEMWSPVPAGEKNSIRFPILVRCSSSGDSVCSAEFRAVQVDGHPATLSTNSTHSFRLLHRLS